MKVKQIFLVTLYFLTIEVALGAKPRSDIFSPMKQTPSAVLSDNLSKPKDFNRNNNLTRRTGSFNIAIGEPLYIKGTVVDAFNVPIEGVIIKIWQTNAAGKYHTLLPKNSKYEDKNFLMSGQAITNNTGHYEFVTIFPGFYDDRAPHINVIISHKKFGIIETELYFDNHFKNKEDPVYMTYSKEDRERITAKMKYVNADDIKKGKIATFDIVMDGVQQYKRY